MPSGHDYANRLREETRRELTERLHSFEREFRSLQATLANSFDQLTQRLGSLQNIEIPALETIFADAASDGARRRDEEMLFLAHFAHDMRRKETQEEILNLLLDGGYRYAPLLALFVARGDQFICWSSRGFSEASARNLKNCSLPHASSPLLQSALKADALITAHDISKESALRGLLAEGIGGPWHAFPMKAIQRPIGVLLASAVEGRSCDLESLCILMDLTGLCIENMALKILNEIRVSRPYAPESHKDRPAAEPVMKTAGADSSSADISAISGTRARIEDVLQAGGTEEVVLSTEFALAPSPNESGMGTEAPEPIPAALPGENSLEPREVAEAAPEEIHAAEDSYEAVSAKDAAQAFPGDAATEDAIPAADKPEPVRTAVLREVQPLTEEEKLHADAKRFARLLASEIKLYNEQRVHEGRENRDLYVRLKRDIDRSRDMYEKRVSPAVSRKVDYFHDEIIRILGDNDPSALGSDYPGPRVES